MIPGWRPVPNKAKSSGEVTVQVDYMPFGLDEKGWKGQVVGAIIFSSRVCQMLKAYPVMSASAEEACLALDNYLSTIVPFLKEKVSCIQTDAGSQFTSGQWLSRCAEDGIQSRACPIDHQEMNGQVKRAQGLNANKMRTLLQDFEIRVVTR